MSINEPTNNVAAIELDMRHVLRDYKARQPDVSTEPSSDYSSLVTQISAQSVFAIDDLIAALQRVREKVKSDGNRLHQAIAQHAALSQSVIELTKIVSDGMTSVNKSDGV